MSKIQCLQVHEGNGICKLYGPKDKITVRVVEPYDPEKYPDKGSVDDQVFREAPYAWEHIKGENMRLAQSLSRPYQQEIPVAELDATSLLVALLYRIDDDVLARGRPIKGHLQRLRDMQLAGDFDDGSFAKQEFWAELLHLGKICPHCKRGVFDE